MDQRQGDGHPGGWADEAERVTDIEFTDLVADPIGQIGRAYDAIGVPLTAEARDAMQHWLNHRLRGLPRPSYSLHDYGLTNAQVDERFLAYNTRFRPGAKHEGAERD